MNATLSTPPSAALARFAKVVVVLTFALILLGGLVTTFNAGMAVATWPTIDGEMNPSGWWQQNHVLLEHSHRLTAILTGILTAILCAWVWGNWNALFLALAVSGLAGFIGRQFHLDGNLIAQLRIWPAAIVFLALLLARRPAPLGSQHWLAIAAYVGVCIQATLGGLRVTQETAGALDAAMILRVVHGCFAQVFLALLVLLAARLSPIWSTLQPHPHAARISRSTWSLIGLLFTQLIIAAAMRHPGAGLAIPTWPKVGDGWLPAEWNTFVTLNFLHTRLIPILITGHLLGLAPRALRATRRIARPALLLTALILVQIALGVLVVWKLKHAHITTVHVFNGAAILAAATLLATRAGRSTSTEVPA